jgi:hypothetical protein
MGTGGPFPGAKARSEPDADHSLPYSAEVKNEYELYLHCPQAPSGRVVDSFSLSFFHVYDPAHSSGMSTFIYCDGYL